MHTSAYQSTNILH